MTGAAADWHTFESRGALAERLAGDVAGSLAQAIAERGVGFLAVSGGTTPGDMFRALSNAAIDWSKVIVTLIDERFVPESSSRSNAALVRATLIQNRARAARFVPLLSKGMPSSANASQSCAGSMSKAIWKLGRMHASLVGPLPVAR